MSKIYLAGHPVSRFDNDFFYLSTSRQNCATCGGRVDCISPPLRYYWDHEFQSEKASLLKDRQMFWGDFFLIVTEPILRKLQELSTFDFSDTCLVHTELAGRELVINQVEQPSKPFYWARPMSTVPARVSGTPNDTCAECGFFVGHPRQLTRLLVDRDDIPCSGIFSVAQNRRPQIFVTEEAKQRLLFLEIAAKFYPAGKIE